MDCNESLLSNAEKIWKYAKIKRGVNLKLAINDWCDWWQTWSLGKVPFWFFRLSTIGFDQTYYQQRHQLNSGCNMLFHVFTLLS